MIAITLPDGSVKHFDAGVTPMDVAKNISEGFARNVISASFNGATIESSTPLTEDGSLVLYTWNNDEGRSEEHTSELQSRENLVCRLLLEKKKIYYSYYR